MQGVQEFLKGHLIDAYVTLKYMAGVDNNSTKLKRQLWKDMGKCMLVGMTLSMGWQYTKGRTHLFRYVKKGIQGALFGFCYSFYFLARKVETEQADRRAMELMNKKETGDIAVIQDN